MDLRSQETRAEDIWSCISYCILEQSNCSVEGCRRLGEVARASDICEASAAEPEPSPGRVCFKRSSGKQHVLGSAAQVELIEEFDSLAEVSRNAGHGRGSPRTGTLCGQPQSSAARSAAP